MLAADIDALTDLKLKLKRGLGARQGYRSRPRSESGQWVPGEHTLTVRAAAPWMLIGDMARFVDASAVEMKRAVPSDSRSFSISPPAQMIIVNAAIPMHFDIGLSLTRRLVF